MFFEWVPCSRLREHAHASEEHGTQLIVLLASSSCHRKLRLSPAVDNGSNTAMKFCFELNEKSWEADLSKPLPIFIDLDFGGLQPNHFGVPQAKQTTFEGGGFVGDTSRGGGCNVDVLQMIPHCNGTHSETVGHIVDRAVDVLSLIHI